MRGTWNAQLYEPTAQGCPARQGPCGAPETESRASRPLADALKAHGLKTLLFAGIETSQCVLVTLLYAHFRGYDCIPVEDRCGATTPGGHAVAVANVSVSLQAADLLLSASLTD